MNIYDCFTYFDEDMVLDLRLNVLNKYVKKFIISEATYTHKGTKKDLRFDINKFKKFKDKIEYVIVDKEPPNILTLNSGENIAEKDRKIILNAYARENFQRDCLQDGLLEANQNDLIIISDVDEIPNLEAINFNKIDNNLIIFNQMMFYYKFNLVYENFNWHGSRACLKKKLISPQWIRNIKSKKYSPFRLDVFFSKKKYTNISFINNGGWHFTNIKTPAEIQMKLSNFLHHHDYEKSNLQTSDLKDFIEKKVVMYDHSLNMGPKEYRWSGKKTLKKIQNNFLPTYLVSNLEKYKKWLD